LSGNLSVLDSISIGSLSQYTGRFTRYLKTSNISPYIDLNIGSVGTIGTWRGRINFQTSYNTEDPTTAMTINEFGNINMNGTLGVSGAVTLSSTLAVTGNITEGGNNVLTNLDTVSLSNRINAKYNSSGGTISGAVTLSTTTATPTALLGKDGSNVVGEVALGTGMSVSGGILSVQAAGASATGLVTSFGSQIFGGNKTFNGTVTLNDELNLSSGYLKRGYLSSTSTSITVGDNDTWLNIHQDAEVTITLPLASSYTGRELIIKQTGSGVVTSASSNIIGFTTAFNGSTQTAIINPANYRFATLVSDGTNWIIMQRNN